jgi:hypothetical protein
MNKSEQVEKWYVDNYKDKSSLRFETFRLALKDVYKITENPYIFETGTVRMKNDFGAGYSTYIFGECISIFGGKLFTVDNSERNMQTSKLITEKFANNIIYILDDSLNAIKNFNEKIDLLYLDSFDCPIEGDATESQKHNLQEFLLAENKLRCDCRILIDDVNFPNGGKSKLTHEHLEKNNYKLIHKNQQSLWKK